MKNKYSFLPLLLLLFSSTMSGQIPTFSLIGHYPFSGNANDLSGNNHNGTVNGATLTADRFGNPNSAYVFNGTSNYIQLPAGSYTTLNIYSYSLWMKPVTTGGIPIWCGESSYGYGQGLGFNTGQIIFAGSYNFGSNPQQSYITSSSLTANQWMHVVMTRDFTSVKLYVNGVQVTPVGTANTNNQSANYGSNQPIKAYIGARTIGTAYFNGAIDGVRIYGTVLSQNDVTALYNESCFAPFPSLSYTACAGNSLSLTAIPGPSSTISWHSSPTGSTTIGTGSVYTTPVLNSPGTYTYYPAASSCTAYSRPPITITVNPNPTISVNSGTICSGNSFLISPGGAAN
jgi:hypothetical protein